MMKLVFVWLIAAAGTFGLVIEAAAQGPGNRPTDTTNASLDQMKDQYRPEGPNARM